MAEALAEGHHPPARGAGSGQCHGRAKHPSRKHVRRLLVEQVTGRVRWRESILALRALGVDTTVEFGGNKVLTGMVKRIDKELADCHARYARRNRSFREEALLTMFDLTGKTALVTGASGGIGGAIAKALHAQGATVVLSGTRVEALEARESRTGLARLHRRRPIFPTPPRSKLCPRRRKRRPAPPSTSWSTMPASPATISSCA